MPFHLIKGTFNVVNYSPDGDTVRFAPADESNMALLSGPPAKFNARRHVSLRLEGIDTLETHFSGIKQPPPLADDATDFLLDGLGIKNVVWSNERRSIVSADDGVEGYIMARSTDKFQRVIAFAFASKAQQADGSEVFLDPGMLAESANFHLAAEGFAYPTFYWGLFADLREAISEASVTARDEGNGVHAVDKTNSGFQAPTLSTITDDVVIMPKLFRRLSTYIKETGTSTGFKAALAANAEPVLDLREQNFTHFDTFVEENAGEIKLTRRPEEFVFDPMPQRLASDFQALMRAAANPEMIATTTVGNDGLMSTMSGFGDGEALEFQRRVQRLIK